MKRCLSYHFRPAGFSLIESMIALFVLSIGLLGMAALMMNVTKVAAERGKFDQALKLTKGKLSQLGHVEWNLVATGTGSVSALLYGAPDEQVVVEGPLNYLGLTSAESAVTPYVFTRSLVMCMDDVDGGSNAAASPGASACGDVTVSRPTELACDVSTLTEGQARARVLTTYVDRTGKCHKIAMDQLLVDFQ